MNSNLLLPQISINDFDYHLPDELIANFPSENRDESRLLFADLNSNKLHDQRFSDIVQHIPSDSMIVVNSTKVIAARLFMQKSSGGKAELLCIEPKLPSFDPVITMQAKHTCTWECMVGGKKIKEGDVLTSRDSTELTARVVKKEQNILIVEFNWQSEETFAAILERLGKIPLPPYIKRDDSEIDKDRYQTVYAKQDGSIAAPTAGLHFTESVFEKLRQNYVKIEEIILHVGPGTFKPVEFDNAAEHEMHSEQIFVSRETIINLIDALENNRNIIATGTTSLRTLESLYWHGAMCIFEEDYFVQNSVNLEKWHSYHVMKNYALPNSQASLGKILEWLDYHKQEIVYGKTSLYIMSGYKFQIINGLITNFHLPKSTLLLLVSAFTGFEMWKKIYDFALNEKYRFLSYGDSSLLLRSK